MNLPNHPSPWERPTVEFASPTVRSGAPLPPPPSQPPASPRAPLPSPGAPQPPAPKRRWGRTLGLTTLVLAAMLGSGVVGAVVANSMDDGDSLPPQRASEAALDVSDGGDELPRMDVAGVADYVAPSVVTISADVEGPLAEVGQSVGTGVIITADGEILTNAHVVEGATEVRVRLVGESEPRSATILASDPGNDLALLRIAGDDFVPATFAGPGSTGIGDEVVAIGFALDLDGGPSVTLGIVSALGRTIQTGPNEFLDGLIQTDAAISSGNSGGPLVNAAGEVVGINTAVARGDFQTAASNIGFAISVAEALPVVDQLRDQANGAVREDGFLGVSLEERTDGGQGAIVVDVLADTPADDAGLVVGDVVIEVDGSAINGGTGLVAAIRDREPGDAISIKVLRDGELIETTATLTTRPTDDDE
jgi:putative serine protease PepD